MAILIPSFNSCKYRMTLGEKRLAERLEDKLEDDYLLWYDVPVGQKQLHPDFIILHPNRGILVLEVKDWKLDTIRNVNRSEFQLVTENGVKKEKNPLRQARDYVLYINKVLSRDASLVEPVDSPYQGKLTFPYGYGVVLSNITRKAFEQAKIDKVISPQQVICQDEMYDSVDGETFQKRLWDMFIYEFDRTLIPEQIKRIRWHIFPDITIQSEQLSLIDEKTEVTQPVEIPIDLLRIMDLQQERLARSLGEGHRVIHGVAGSGKTLILVYRCEFLAKSINKQILVLCFNVSLASKLKQIIRDKGLTDTVKVHHFHGWCTDQLNLYGIAKPDKRQFRGEAYVQQLVQKLIDSIDEGLIPTGKYGAVLIDEGHDFQDSWLKLLTQIIDPETNSLLLLYDDAQNLYDKQKKRKTSFKSIGIQAQGRTTILKVNYRNTSEVLELAYEFAKEVMISNDSDGEDIPVLVQPQTAGRHGIPPQLIKLPSFGQEAKYIVRRSQDLHERGVSWNEIAVIYRTDFMGVRISRELRQAQIPVEWINRDKDSRFYQPHSQSIKLLTMHSSKGLEFPIVFIPGLGFMPTQHNSPADEARLLYVAMTRSTDQLILTCDRPSEFVDRVKTALEKIFAV